MNKYKLRRSPSLRREVHRLLKFVILVSRLLPAKPPASGSWHPASSFRTSHSELRIYNRVADPLLYFLTIHFSLFTANEVSNLIILSPILAFIELFIVKIFLFSSLFVPTLFLSCHFKGEFPFWYFFAKGRN